MSAGLLRKQNLLRNVAEEHRSSCSAARQSLVPITSVATLLRGCGRWIGSSRGNIVDFLEPRLTQRIRRRRSRSFVFASSDPKT